MQERQHRSFFESIPPGREGYVYLIHAQEATRYKIGWSVNPILRRQELQKQSPYPLKIVKSFWTLDAIAEESLLHKHFSKWRIFGEWFDLAGEGNAFGPPKVEMVLKGFYFSSVICKLADEATAHLCQKLGFDPEVFEASTDIWSLYESASSRQEVLLVDFFVRETLFQLFTEKYPRLERDFSSLVNLLREGEIYGFFNGCISAFQFTVLKKRVR